MEGLNGRNDFFDRLFVGQYHLTRYMESGDKSHARRLAAVYQGVASLKKLPEDNPAFNEYLWLAKYLDAAVLMYVEGDQNAAKSLLDAYCPQRNQETKMRCHAQNIDHFDRSAVYYGRYASETTYLLNTIIGDAYHHAGFKGHAIRAKAYYDIQAAERQSRAYLERNAWNDRVRGPYCEFLNEYRHSPDMKAHADYVAAFARSNCQELIESSAGDTTVERG